MYSIIRVKGERPKTHYTAALAMPEAIASATAQTTNKAVKPFE